MDITRVQAGQQRPAPHIVTDLPPREPITGRDVVLNTRAAPPVVSSPVERSNAELAEALAAFQWGFDPPAPQEGHPGG